MNKKLYLAMIPKDGGVKIGTTRVYDGVSSNKAFHAEDRKNILGKKEFKKTGLNKVIQHVGYIEIYAESESIRNKLIASVLISKEKREKHA